ncbi:MAG: 4Fe-4S dicluster domain-containing protein, partial [Planctomycetota bacterium]
LLARSPDSKTLRELADSMGVGEPRFTLPEEEQSKSGCILCGLCVRACRDLMEVGAISFVNRGVGREVGTPFGVPSDICRTCGACERICPTGAWKLSDVVGREVEVLASEYQEGLESRGAIYSPFAQAVPNVPTIDRTACAHFLADACGLCEKVCPAEAIDYSQVDREEEIDVGAVVLSPGFDEFDPTGMSEYGYGRYPNVYTSIEFERLSNASGPFGGHLKRRSDGETPRRIAFLQCVGSRDGRCDRDYCSSVCCMYAVKESVIAKEHDTGLDIAIFGMDIRSYGKDFDRFIDRARDEYGIRMVRSRIASLEEDADTKNIRLR